MEYGTGGAWIFHLADLEFTTKGVIPFENNWKASLHTPNYMSKQLFCEVTGQSWDRVDHLENGWCEYKEKEMSEDSRRKMFFNSFVGMYESLNDAVHKAGGSGFSLDKLNEMSAADLLECLATNSIKFVCTKSKEK